MPPTRGTLSFCRRWFTGHHDHIAATAEKTERLTGLSEVDALHYRLLTSPPSYPHSALLLAVGHTRDDGVMEQREWSCMYRLPRARTQWVTGIEWMAFTRMCERTSRELQHCCV